MPTSRADLLAAAKGLIYLSHEPDTSAKLATQNLMYGLGRILFALQEIDPGATAAFLGAPDFTITRTATRWKSGFAYGGVLVLRNSTRAIVFPELRPNTCGTTVGLLKNDLQPREFVRRVSSRSRNSGQPEWDYSRRNHFVNLYRSSVHARQAFVIHGCPSWIKSDSAAGPGLNIDYSKFWQIRADRIESPLGDVAVLTDDDALSYWHNYLRCDAISKKERRELASALFGDYDLLSESTHEGMLCPTLYNKGCHVAKNHSDQFPVLTAPGSNVFVVTAPGTKRPGGTSELPVGCVAVIPHGTGYDLPLPSSELECWDHEESGPLFVFRGPNGGISVYADFSHTPYAYRSSNLVQVWATAGYFLIVDTLEPVVSAKL